MLTKKITAQDITAVLPDIIQENLPLYHMMKVIAKYNDQVASWNGEGYSGRYHLHSFNVKDIFGGSKSMS